MSPQDGRFEVIPIVAKCKINSLAWCVDYREQGGWLRNVLKRGHAQLRDLEWEACMLLQGGLSGFLLLCANVGANAGDPAAFGDSSGKYEILFDLTLAIRPGMMRACPKAS